MKVLVTGASGLVGSAVYSYFESQGCKVIGSHYSYQTAQTVFLDTVNINNPKNFDILAYKPDVIVHCGALTNVDLAERQPDESYTQTVISTQNLLRFSQICEAIFVYISTDYVFDGQKGFYQEIDPPNPINWYGKHKLMAEQLVQSTTPKHLIVRITNVYGYEVRNKNFAARLIKQIHEQQSLALSLPYDQFATPIYAHDIARCLWVLLQKHSRGLYHLASTDYLNRCQLAEKIIRFFQYPHATIRPIATSQLNQTAVRPLLGGMCAYKFIAENPDFRFTCVDDFLKELSDGI